MKRLTVFRELPYEKPWKVMLLTLFLKRISGFLLIHTYKPRRSHEYYILLTHNGYDTFRWQHKTNFGPLGGGIIEFIYK